MYLIKYGGIQRVKLFILEHMSQLLLTYFKQLHGEQSFSEIFFLMPLLTDSKINLNDILQKDIINIFDNDIQFREKYVYNLLWVFFLISSFCFI